MESASQKLKKIAIAGLWILAFIIIFIAIIAISALVGENEKKSKCDEEYVFFVDSNYSAEATPCRAALNKINIINKL